MTIEAEFIATFSPARILILLEQLEIAKEELKFFADKEMWKTFMVGKIEMQQPAIVNGQIRAENALARMEELEC